jgi:hypothetical protein
MQSNVSLAQICGSLAGCRRLFWLLNGRSIDTGLRQRKLQSSRKNIGSRANHGQRIHKTAQRRALEIALAVFLAHRDREGAE